VLEPLGLEPRQFALLRYVAAAEGHSQQELGAVLQVPASRMVALLDEMEERGLLERRAHPTDRRAKALYLTPGGSKTLTQAMEAAAAFEGEVTAGLGADEREELVSLLQRLAANLELTFGVHPALAAHGGEMGSEPPDPGCARP
jgi:DNA-binding MarR family transcriptional regulator